MKPEDATYTLQELCDAAGVTVRTVRYYVSQGLLRSPSGAGPLSRYDGGHLARLRLIRRLQRDHLPLAEIRRRLAALSDQEAIDLLEQPTPEPSGSALDYIRSALSSRGVSPAATSPAPAPAMAPPPRLVLGSPAMAPAPPPPPAPAAGPARAAEERAPYRTDPSDGPDRSTWERIALDPDIELHVRRPLSRPQSRAVDRLVQAARRILKEDLP
jgi:DNA-binding transcriptional MerR regulator